MKRILLIMPYGSVGGMERLALTFYEKYRQMGYEVKALKIIRLDTDIINFGPDELYLSQKDFSQMPAAERIKFYALAPWRIRRIIKQYRITDSISFGDMANVFSSLTFTREHKIGSIHSFKSIEFTVKNPLNRLFKFAMRSSYRYFDKVVAISHAVKSDLVQHCGFAFPEKLQVIYNPHDIAYIENAKKEPLPAEESYVGENTILFVGRLCMAKAPWHLLNAFKLLSEQREANLVFLGDGVPQIEQTLKRMTREYGLENRVYFLGRRSNPYAYMARCGVVALSSYYEGTPNVIVEAIAAGVPVVSSNCTDGVAELMSTHLTSVPQNETTRVEAGFITPGFFKGSLEMPDVFPVTKEEQQFADALALVLDDATVKTDLLANRLTLLKKFDTTLVAGQYLAPLPAGTH